MLELQPNKSIQKELALLIYPGRIQNGTQHKSTGIEELVRQSDPQKQCDGLAGRSLHLERSENNCPVTHMIFLHAKIYSFD